MYIESNPSIGHTMDWGLYYAALYGGIVATQKLILQFKADVLIRDTRLGGDLMMAASTTAMDCPKMWRYHWWKPFCIESHSLMFVYQIGKLRISSNLTTFELDIADSSNRSVVALCHSSGLGQEWKDCPRVPSAEAEDRTESADSQVAAAWLWDKRCVTLRVLDCLPKMVLETSRA